MSEQFATKQLVERHENVVQGATDRRERREAASSFDKHQNEEEVKRAVPQRVNSHPFLRRHYYGGADDAIYVADSTNQDDVEDAKNAVEVSQVHDTNKIARRSCAETEEGLKRPKKMEPWQRRLRKRTWYSTSTESWTYQWTRSLLMLKTPDHVAQSVTVTWNRSLTFLLMVLRRLLFKHRQPKPCGRESLLHLSFGGEAASGSPSVTQEVMVPDAGLARVIGRSVREPRGADGGKHCGGAAGTDR